nr:hypothetical protein [uncultured Vibrio sp.]
MSQVRKIVTTAPIRCCGKSVKPETELTVGEHLTKNEAISLVSLGKAEWIEPEQEEQQEAEDE